MKVKVEPTHASRICEFSIARNAFTRGCSFSGISFGALPLSAAHFLSAPTDIVLVAEEGASAAEMRNGSAPEGEAWLLEGTILQSIPQSFRYVYNSTTTTTASDNGIYNDWFSVSGGGLYPPAILDSLG